MDMPIDNLAPGACPSGAPSATSGFTRAVIEATTFEAHRRILIAAIAAKRDLGIDATEDCRELAHLSYRGPTVISAIRIVGWRKEPMYDERPDIDFASFRRRRAKLIEFPPQTLEGAQIAFRCQDVLDAWFGSLDSRRLPLPADLPSGIAHVELLDNLGHVVAEADFDADTGLRWRPTAAMADLDIDATLRRADELERIATFETAWDNFSTAEGLRDQAAALRRRVSIAQHAPRLAAGGAGGRR